MNFERVGAKEKKVFLFTRIQKKYKNVINGTVNNGKRVGDS
jgi:hypothetical protein